MHIWTIVIISISFYFFPLFHIDNLKRHEALLLQIVQPPPQYFLPLYSRIKELIFKVPCVSEMKITHIKHRKKWRLFCSTNKCFWIRWRQRSRIDFQTVCGFAFWLFWLNFFIFRILISQTTNTKLLCFF